MTRQLVWIDKEKERVVPVELNEDIAAAMECQFSTEAQWSAALEAAPPHTLVSLPSEEELKATLRSAEAEFRGGFGGDADDFRARAIRKLLTDKEVEA